MLIKNICTTFTSWSFKRNDKIYIPSVVWWIVQKIILTPASMPPHLLKFCIKISNIITCIQVIMWLDACYNTWQKNTTKYKLIANTNSSQHPSIQPTSLITCIEQLIKRLMAARVVLNRWFVFFFLQFQVNRPTSSSSSSLSASASSPTANQLVAIYNYNIYSLMSNSG